MSTHRLMSAHGRVVSELSWRPGDTRIDPRFRFVDRQRVRFRDLDALGHVNHAVYLTYVEQARTLYFRQVLQMVVPDDLRWVIATQRCDYRAPLGFAEIFDVGWRLTRLGRSSADFEFEIATSGGSVAGGGGVIVYADPRAGRSIPMPADLRRRAAEFDAIE